MLIMVKLGYYLLLVPVLVIFTVAVLMLWRLVLPLVHVLEIRRVEVLHRTDRRPRVGMTGRVALLGEGAIDLAVGLVFALPLLVLHDTALLGELRLIDLFPSGPDRHRRPHRSHPKP